MRSASNELTELDGWTLSLIFCRGTWRTSGARQEKDQDPWWVHFEPFSWVTTNKIIVCITSFSFVCIGTFLKNWYKYFSSKWNTGRRNKGAQKIQSCRVHRQQSAAQQGRARLEAIVREVCSRPRWTGRHRCRSRTGQDSAAIQASPQHPQQADATEVRWADEAGEGADHWHHRETEGSHRPHLWEGHLRAQLLRGLRQHVQLPYQGILFQNLVFCIFTHHYYNSN